MLNTNKDIAFLPFHSCSQLVIYKSVYYTLSQYCILEEDYSKLTKLFSTRDNLKRKKEKEKEKEKEGWSLGGQRKQNRFRN
jgi:hypothetical protein